MSVSIVASIPRPRWAQYGEQDEGEAQERRADGDTAERQALQRGHSPSAFTCAYCPSQQALSQGVPFCAYALLSGARRCRRHGIFGTVANRHG